jgi:hypothetical protein
MDNLNTVRTYSINWSQEIHSHRTITKQALKHFMKTTIESLKKAMYAVLCKTGQALI